MDKQNIGFQKLYWEDVRDQVRSVNPQLAGIIDNINPGKDYPLVKASYRFGDLIVEDGHANLPTQDGTLLPATDVYFQKQLKDQLTYSPIPVFLTLKNANELFVNTSSRAIPLNLFYPGSLLGLFEYLDYMFDRQSTARWNVSAGARSIFTLPKMNEIAGFKRLKIAYGLDSGLQPRYLTDHWRVFCNIVRHQNFDQNWDNEILFFTKSWLTDHSKDPTWFAFRDYLFKHAWNQAQFAISKVGLNLSWEYFSTAISARNLKPIPYLIDHVKHILLTAAGRWPGFIPADTSNQVAPTDGLQKAITETYMLKKYLPTMMHIASLERNVDIPTYYSLAYPTLLEGSPKSKTSASTIMIDLRDIKQLIDTIKTVFHDSNKIDCTNFSNVDFDYFHVEQDKYSEIKLSNSLHNIDMNLVNIKDMFPDKEFCSTSQFWRGCIRIIRNPLA